jgi:molybdate transport system substrate-binding protein
MMRTIPLLAGTLALVTGVLTVEVDAAEVKVLSAGAMRGILQELAPAFETASGHKLKIDYATAGVVEQKVAADDEIDVAILTKPRVDKLVREAKIVGGYYEDARECPDRSGGEKRCHKAGHQLSRGVQESAP